MSQLDDVAESAASPGKAFTDLTGYIEEEELSKLDAYLLEHNVPQYDAFDIFPANGQKHADAIKLCDRDTSTWCEDVFAAYSSHDDFRQCRAHRGDPKTWRHNHNARLFPGVIDFAAKLPFFEKVGNIVVIVNAPNSAGVEHCDHTLPDLVSEFIWVRTASSNKRFFVRNPSNGEAHFVGRKDAADCDEKSEGGRCNSRACVAWFDDHLMHNIEPVDSELQWSVRIDGRFTPKFRELIARTGTFGAQEGLRGVFAAQHNGPAFLQEPNSPPASEDEDEEEEEEEEEEEPEVLESKTEGA